MLAFENPARDTPVSRVTLASALGPTSGRAGLRALSGRLWPDSSNPPYRPAVPGPAAFESWPRTCRTRPAWWVRGSCSAF